MWSPPQGAGETEMPPPPGSQLARKRWRKAPAGRPQAHASACASRLRHQLEPLPDRLASCCPTCPAAHRHPAASRAAMGSDPTPPVPAAHFAYSRRPRDRLWALIFALAWVAAVAGGIYAVQHRNPAFIHLDYSDPASCPAHPEAARALREALREKHGGDFSPSQFVQLAGETAREPVLGWGAWSGWVASKARPARPTVPCCNGMTTPPGAGRPLAGAVSGPGPAAGRGVREAVPAPRRRHDQGNHRQPGGGESARARGREWAAAT